MHHYEIVLMVHPDQEGRITEIVGRCKQIVADAGGQVHRLEEWGRRTLAYPVRKLHKACYVLMNIEAPAEAVTEIKGSWRYDDAVLRNLITRQTEAVTEESWVMVRQREQRQQDGRADGGGRNAARRNRADSGTDEPAAKESSPGARTQEPVAEEQPAE